MTIWKKTSPSTTLNSMVWSSVVPFLEPSIKNQHFPAKNNSLFQMPFENSYRFPGLFQNGHHNWEYFLLPPNYNCIHILEDFLEWRFLVCKNWIKLRLTDDSLKGHEQVHTSNNAVFIISWRQFGKKQIFGRSLPSLNFKRFFLNDIIWSGPLPNGKMYWVLAKRMPAIKSPPRNK